MGDTTIEPFCQDVGSLQSSHLDNDAQAEK